jgi:sulfopyruvate decarboxylase subunit alpha
VYKLIAFRKSLIANRQARRSYPKTLQVSSKASRALYEALKKVGVDFVVTFPCNWTSILIDFIACDSDIIHIPVTREEEGVGIAAGAYLGGKKPAMIMQSSGIGNSLNALGSLNLTCKIPLLILISHRGIEREKIVAQKGMGQALKKLLAGVGIQYFDLIILDEIEKILTSAFDFALNKEKPVAVILSPFLLLEE